MTHNLRLAFIIIGFLIMGWFISPTVRWYFFTSEEKKDETNLSLDEMIAKGYSTEDVEKINKLKRLRSESINLGLDLQGGVRIVLQADFPAYAQKLGISELQLTEAEKIDAMDRLLDRLSSRIDQFGVSEVGIRKQGADSVVIDLPGASDPDRVKNIVLSEGALSFHIVDSEASSTITMDDMHLGVYTNLDKIPKDRMLLYMYNQTDDYGRRLRGMPIIVEKEASLEGDMLKDSWVSTGQFGESAVSFEMNSQGTDIFANVTRNNSGRMLAIVLDEKVVSAPNINEPITTGSGVISGSFGYEEAQNLAKILKEGALPLGITIVEEEIVGQTIGSDSVRAGTTALIMAALLVSIFMIVSYKLSGILSVIAMAVNVILIIAVLSPLQFTLTLPGIAGFILTIGMAVDANVIILERIKDELATSKGFEEAIISGYNRAFATIFDSNLTTIIVAFILWVFGRGPVQGFAVTLFFGILINLFTAVFITRYIYEELLNRRIIKKNNSFFI